MSPGSWNSADSWRNSANGASSGEKVRVRYGMMVLGIQRRPRRTDLEFSVDEKRVSEVKSALRIGKEIERSAGDGNAQHALSTHLKRLDNVSADLATVKLRCHGIR